MIRYTRVSDLRPGDVVEEVGGYFKFVVSVKRSNDMQYAPAASWFVIVFWSPRSGVTDVRCGPNREFLKFPW